MNEAGAVAFGLVLGAQLAQRASLRLRTLGALTAGLAAAVGTISAIAGLTAGAIAGVTAAMTAAVVALLVSLLRRNFDGRYSAANDS